MAAELELALVREALQTRLLVELMSNAMHKELVLKGGMAMRAVHGSVRYTKNIDLDADERASKERIQGVVRRSIERAVSSGLIANALITAPKQTDTTLRWKITGTQPNSAAPMHLTVEVSRRPRLIEGHVVEVPLDKSFNHTGRDVRVQVPTEVGQAIDSEAFDAMRVDVGVAVEGWLQTAAAAAPEAGS